MRFKRNERKCVAVCGLVAIILIAAVKCPAQDARVAEARKEGKVVWYTGATLFTAERVASAVRELLARR